MLKNNGGIKAYYSKGRWYAYHRCSRTRIRATWGTTSFDEELAKIKLASAKRQSQPPQTGSFLRALNDFQASDDFRALPLRIRAGWWAVIPWLPPKDTRRSVASFDAAHARRLRDKAARSRGVRFGNMTLALVQGTIAYCVKIGSLTANRVADVPKLSLLPPKATQRRRLPFPPRRKLGLTDSAKKQTSNN